MTTAETSERERDAEIAIVLRGLVWKVERDKRFVDHRILLHRGDDGEAGMDDWDGKEDVPWFQNYGSTVPHFHTDAVAMVQLIEGMRAKWRSTHDDNDGEGEHHWSFYSKEVDADGDAKYWGHGYGPTLMAAVAGAAWAALAAAEERSA